MISLSILALCLLAGDSSQVNTRQYYDTMSIDIQGTGFQRKPFSITIDELVYTADTVACENHKWWVDVGKLDGYNYKNWKVKLGEDIVNDLRIDTSKIRCLQPDRKKPTQLILTLEKLRSIHVISEPRELPFCYNSSEYSTDHFITMPSASTKEINILFQILQCNLVTDKACPSYPESNNRITKLVFGNTVKLYYVFTYDLTKTNYSESRMLSSQQLNQAVIDYCSSTGYFLSKCQSDLAHNSDLRTKYIGKDPDPVPKTWVKIEGAM
jgi:hypothetical protein